MSEQKIDLVTLVNESDQVIGSLDKIEAHRGEGKLHRAVSVYLFNKVGDLLIQQRSTKKIVGAGEWANTVCGNVRPNETYEECAYRRLREELGITKVEIKEIYEFQYHLRCNEQFSEYEIDRVFVGSYSAEVVPNSDEVQDFTWVNWVQLLTKLTQNLVFNNVSTQKMVGKILPKITIALSFSADKQITLAPWFVWMLKDNRLSSIINTYINRTI